MSLYEIELKQLIESRFGTLANTMAVIIFDQYRKLLDHLYSFLKYSHLQIVFDQAKKRNLAYLRSNDQSEIKLRLSESDLKHLNQLQNSRVKIGKVGEYNIYFDLRSQNIFSFDYGKRILDDPLETNAVIFDTYQQAFVTIEQLGPIAEVIVHKETGAISFFLKDGSQRVIDQQHNSFLEISEILSGRLIEVGKVAVDELMYCKPIGFFNGKTGKPIASPKEVITFLDPAAQQALELVSKNVEVRAENAERFENENLVLIIDGRETIILPNDPLHHLVKKLRAEEPVMVGRCEGRDKVYFSWATGPIIKTDFRIETMVYQEINEKYNIDKKIIPHSHIYYSNSNPGVLAILLPNQRNKSVRYLRPSDQLFPILQKLAQGQVGIHSDESTGNSYTLVYNTEYGLVFDKQPTAKLALALESLHSVFFDLDFKSLQEPVFSTTAMSKGRLKKEKKRLKALEKSRKSKTKREKRKQEREKLPKK